MSIIIAICLVLLCPLAASAQQIALHATEAERAIWNVRRVSGPFKADFDEILDNANLFRSNPSGNDPKWAGNTCPSTAWDGACAYRNNCSTTCLNTNNQPEYEQGEKMRDAAFQFLLTGDTSYRAPVLARLLDIADDASTNFANTTRWSPNYHHGLDYFIANWLTLVTYAYSYIRSSISTADRNTIDTWLLNAGNWIYGEADQLADDRFPGRESDNYGSPFGTPTGTNWDNDIRGRTHFGGFTVYNFSDAFENVQATRTHASCAVGILLNNAALKVKAKRLVKEWIWFGTYSDGSTADQRRWGGAGDNEGAGYGYPMTVISSNVACADMFARAGDTELYDFATSAGAVAPFSTGGAKSFLEVLQRFANITLLNVTLYGSNTATTNECLRIDPDDLCANPTRTQFRAGYVTLCQANVYYDDPLLAQACARPSNYPIDGGTYNEYGGDWGNQPGLRGLHALMEDEPTVDPFGADSTPPTVTVTANPTTTETTSALTWSSTNATSCTASCNNADCDGWTGLKTVSGGPETVSPAATTEYCLSCSGAGGTVPDCTTVILSPPGQGFRVTKFQFRPFTGSEASPQTANPSFPLVTYTASNDPGTVSMIEDGCIGLQMCIECDADLQCPTGPLPLHVRKNGTGTFIPLTAATGDVFYADAPDVGHNAPTTNRLTCGTTFVPGHVIETNVLLGSETLLTTQSTNMLYMLCGGDAVVGDFVELRPHQENGEAFVSYITPRLDIGTRKSRRGSGGTASGGGTTQ